MAAYHCAFWWYDAWETGGDGRVDAECFVDDGVEDLQMAGRSEGDVIVCRKGGFDFLAQSRHPLRRLEEVVHGTT